MRITTVERTGFGMVLGIAAWAALGLGCEQKDFEQKRTEEPQATASSAVTAVQIPTVDSVEVTVLVDNFFDFFQKEEKIAKRLLLVNQPSFNGVEVQAEMGLGYLIVATVGGVRHKILMDFGLSTSVYGHNLCKLNADLSGVEAIVVSHGHKDHWGGVRLAEEITGAPLYVGSTDAFLKHLLVTPAGHVTDLGTLNQSNFSQVHVVSTPTVIASTGLLSGLIARTTTYENIPKSLQMVLPNGSIVPATFTEELALIFNVAGKGLVVINSCAHRGVVNSVLHAQNITGISTVNAVIGGMHLTTASDAVIASTVNGLSSLNVGYVAPMHCTGNRAMTSLANNMPAAFVPPSVGTRLVVGTPPVPPTFATDPDDHDHAEHDQDHSEDRPDTVCAGDDNNNQQ